MPHLGSPGTIIISRFRCCPHESGLLEGQGRQGSNIPEFNIQARQEILLFNPPPPDAARSASTNTNIN
jgi:hypothetical protein